MHKNIKTKVIKKENEKTRQWKKAIIFTAEQFVVKKRRKNKKVWVWGLWFKWQ